MPMAQSQDAFKRGSAELVVLHLLRRDDMYGYQIVQELSKRSGGRYRLLEGSLSMLLMRMEEAGFVVGRTELVGKRRTRRYYTLTDAGRTRHTQLLQDYRETIRGIQMILDEENETDA